MTTKTDRKWVVGSPQEFATYSANMVFEGDKSVAQVYGLPMNVTLEEAERDPRYAEGLANARLIASAPTLRSDLAEATALLRILADARPSNAQARWDAREQARTFLARREA